MLVDTHPDSNQQQQQPSSPSLLVLSCHCQRNVLGLAVGDRPAWASVGTVAERPSTHLTSTTMSEARAPSPPPSRQQDELDEHQQEEERPSSDRLVSSSGRGGGDDDDDNDGVCQVCACSWCIKRRAVWLCTGIARSDVQVLQTSGGEGDGGARAGGKREEGRLSPSFTARYGLEVLRGFSGDHVFPRLTGGVSESLARASDSSHQKPDDGDGDDDGESKTTGGNVARGEKTAVEAAAAATITIYRFSSSSSPASIPSSSSGEVPIQRQGRGQGASHVSCSTCGTFMLSYGFPSRRQVDTLDRRSSIADDATDAAQGGRRAEEVVWLNVSFWLARHTGTLVNVPQDGTRAGLFSGCNRSPFSLSPGGL